jgi:transposase
LAGTSNLLVLEESFDKSIMSELIPINLQMTQEMTQETIDSIHKDDEESMTEHFSVILQMTQEMIQEDTMTMMQETMTQETINSNDDDKNVNPNTAAIPVITK